MFETGDEVVLVKLPDEDDTLRYNENFYIGQTGTVVQTHAYDYYDVRVSWHDIIDDDGDELEWFVREECLAAIPEAEIEPLDLLKLLENTGEGNCLASII